MKFARPLAVSGTVACLFLAACATSASAPQLTYGVVY
jgi:hypothetical protein